MRQRFACSRFDVFKQPKYVNECIEFKPQHQHVPRLNSVFVLDCYIVLYIYIKSYLNLPYASIRYIVWFVTSCITSYIHNLFQVHLAHSSGWIHWQPALPGGVSVATEQQCKSCDVQDWHWIFHPHCCVHAVLGALLEDTVSCFGHETKTYANDYSGWVDFNWFGVINMWHEYVLSEDVVQPSFWGIPRWSKSKSAWNECGWNRERDKLIELAARNMPPHLYAWDSVRSQHGLLIHVPTFCSLHVCNVQVKPDRLEWDFFGYIELICLTKQHSNVAICLL